MSGPPNTILVEPADGQQRVIEKAAASITTPGSILAVNSSDEFALAGAALVNAAKIIALENVADAGGIDDDYAADDRCRGLYFQSGDLILTRSADAQTLAIGDPLEIGAAGTVQAWVAGTLIGHAAEVITASSAGDPVLVRAA